MIAEWREVRIITKIFMPIDLSFLLRAVASCLEFFITIIGLLVSPCGKLPNPKRRECSYRSSSPGPPKGFAAGLSAGD